MPKPHAPLPQAPTLPPTPYPTFMPTVLVTVEELMPVLPDELPCCAKSTVRSHSTTQYYSIVPTYYFRPHHATLILSLITYESTS
jgi:hypothetical protein